MNSPGRLMGLAYHIVEALVREHKYRAIQGEVLLIGRQAVYCTAREILALLRDHNIEPALEAAEIEVDRSTTNRGPGKELLTDLALVRLLGLPKGAGSRS